MQHIPGSPFQVILGRKKELGWNYLELHSKPVVVYFCFEIGLFARKTRAKLVLGKQLKVLVESKDRQLRPHSTKAV